MNDAFKYKNLTVSSPPKEQSLVKNFYNDKLILYKKEKIRSVISVVDFEVSRCYSQS